MKSMSMFLQSSFFLSQKGGSPHASFSPASAEPLIGPYSFRPAWSSSDAHSSPSIVRELNNILLIPRGAVEQQFLSSAEKRRNGDRAEDDVPCFSTDSVDVPGDTPHVLQETPHNPQGTPHEPQAGSHVPQY
jgi:hypothetical protein